MGKLWPYLFAATIVLAALKLTGALEVTWWIVTLPLWGAVLLSAALLLVGGALMAIGYGLGFIADLVSGEYRKRRARKRKLKRAFAVLESFTKKHGDR